LSVGGLGAAGGGAGLAVGGAGGGCDGFLFGGEVEIEEGPDHGEDFRAVEAIAVAGTEDGVEMDAGSGGFQGFVEEFALLVGDDGVLIAVDDEEGRVVRGDVGDGVG